MATIPDDFGFLLEALERRTLLASTSTLLQYDFSSTAWQQSPGALSTGVTAALAQGGYGTIDTEGSTTTSGALRLTVNSAPASPWSADLTSGQLAVTNTETNLGKLTLSFSLSASQARPVKVIVSSYNAAGQRLGALETQVVPAATYSFQRFALDLSTMTASGSGTFSPTAPKISFDFEMNSQAGWSTATAAQLRLDNVNYAKPAYYVSALTGSNSFNGKTEQTAFATPQAALNLAQPGDIICLMNGTYTNTGTSSNKIQFTKGGTPAAWVTLKNYPGQSPVISSETWNAIAIGGGTKASPATGAAIAYVEVRGLHVIGDSAKVGPRTAPDGPYNASAPAGTYGPYGQYIGQADGRTNGNGITVDGRYETNRPHDIRFADNIVEQCAGGGISAEEADRIQIENNIVRDNCYWDIYGTSGISILSAYQFDGTSGVYLRLVRNNISSGNIHKEMWASAGKYSDGNGIIIDYNHNSSDVPAGVVNGRTLVTNNIAFDNGGSGIHSFMSNHVDIINNTAYRNSASPYLQYGEIFAGSSNTAGSADDVNIFNNILVAPVANTAAGEAPEPVTGGRVSSTIIYKNNVYFGGNTPAPTGTNNYVGDPKFVQPSTDPAVANFRLQSTSPAINRGISTLAPALDIAGVSRVAAPDSGAYEFIPAAPTAVALSPESDTGVAGDGKTNLNNSSPATRLAFTVTGTLSGATVNLYANSVFIGSAVASGTTTTVYTNGTAALADGTASFTANQTFASASSDIVPTPAVVLIDRTNPTIVGTPVINTSTNDLDSRSQIRTITVTFSEPVNFDLSYLSLRDAVTGAVIDLSSRVLSITGNTATLQLDRPGVDASPQLFLPNGNYTLTLSGAVTDTAGNILDANGDGTPGETSSFAFFKLAGDYNGDRHVDFNDFLALQNAFGATIGSAQYRYSIDHDNSGTIDFNDFLFLQNAFGSSLEPPAVARIKTVRGGIKPVAVAVKPSKALAVAAPRPLAAY